MNREITINGTPVQVNVTDEDMAHARAALLRFGTPGDGFWDLAAGSYMRAAQDRRRWTAVLSDEPQRMYRLAVQDYALIAAYDELHAEAVAA